MNAVQPRRSRSFWIWGCLFLFLVHALAIFYFGDRRKNELSWQRPEPFLYIGGDERVDQHLAELAAAPDPTLFALPHPDGFSGGAWKRFEPHTPKLTNWSAAPEWLALPANELGKTLSEHIATNRPSEESLLAALRAPKPLEVRLPSEPIVTNTTARVEGPLAERPLISAPRLPAAVHNDVLRRTVVAVSVNGDGFVESAAVARDSGSPEADSRAVELARAFQFEPMSIRNALARESAPPTIGRVVFSWQVSPPTNGLSAASP